MKHGEPDRETASVNVSIHIHPEGRMKLRQYKTLYCYECKFQSTSTPKGG